MNAQEEISEHDTMQRHIAAFNILKDRKYDDFVLCAQNIMIISENDSPLPSLEYRADLIEGAENALNTIVGAARNGIEGLFPPQPLWLESKRSELNDKFDHLNSFREQWGLEQKNYTIPSPSSRISGASNSGRQVGNSNTHNL